MKKLVNWLVVILVILPLVLTGCAGNYKAAVEAQKDARQAHSLSLSSMPETFAKAIGAINSAFEAEYRKANGAGGQQKYTEKIFYDEQGKPTHTEITYAPMSDLAPYLIAQAKQETSEKLFVALQGIYEYKEWQDPTVTTWEDVAKELVKQTPLMLAIGGLWHMGVEAVNSVGDQVTNYGNYANDGGVIDTSTNINLTDSPLTFTEGQ